MVPLRITPPDIEAWDGKHPLEHSWSFWFFNRDLAQKWEDCVRRIGTFSTIEDFWSYVHHIESPATLANGCELSLFKEHISPMWEDPSNRRGGRWDVHLDRNLFSNEDLTTFWNNLTMDFIGHRFAEYDNLVNGAVVSRREKGYRISIWTGQWQDRERLSNFGKALKRAIGIPHDTRMVFRTHDNCSSNATSHLITLRV